MYPKELDNYLRDGRVPARFLVFAGKEEFLKERSCEQIATALIPEEDRADNLFRVEFPALAVQDVQSEFFRLNFNSSPRVALLGNPEGLSSKDRKKLLEQLVSFPPPEQLTVVFLTADARVAGELAGGLGDACCKVDFWPPFDNQLPAWVQSEGGRAGLKIANDAAAELLARLGPDLRSLAREIEKLAVSWAGRPALTRAMVSQSVTFNRPTTVFDFLDEIGQRNVTGALRVLEHLLQRGEKIQGIWPLFTAMLRRFRALHDITLDRPDLGVPVLNLLSKYDLLHGKSGFRDNQERKSIQEQIKAAVATWPALLSETVGFNRPYLLPSLGFATRFRPRELQVIWPALEQLDRQYKSATPIQALPLQQFLIRFLASPGGTGNTSSTRPPRSGR